MRLEPNRLVFIDETSTNTKMTRLRGRSLCGERLKASAPFGKWGTQTFIAGLRPWGLTAPWAIDGPMNRAVFNAYIETQLAPTLDRGDIVILDNCIVPLCDGISLTDPKLRERLWDRYSTAAPRPRTPSEQQYSDRKLRSKS
jgi:hypothetical protein